jgi:hypothetical protein
LHKENLREPAAVTVIAISKSPSCTVPTMRNSPKIRLFALLAAVACTIAGAADTPARAPLKEGWDRKQIKVFAYACTDGLLEPAVREYKAAALADGVTLYKPFPEKEFRDSAFPMCLCISQRVAETWSMKEMDTHVKERTRPMIDEALSGGRCKPDGMLGDILKKQKEAKP